MADVIYKKGQSANLDDVAIADGQILVTEDTGEMYIDISDGTRKKISDNDKQDKMLTKEASSNFWRPDDNNLKLGYNSLSQLELDNSTATAKLYGGSSASLNTSMGTKFSISNNSTNSEAIATISGEAYNKTRITGITLVKDDTDATNKAYVDQAIYNSGVGRTTTDGGEIFNDYENNKALSPYSHSEGTTSTAGGKGFVIIAKSGTKGNVGTYTLEGYTGGYEVGDIWSACISSNYDFNGTITAIEGNVITVDNYAEGAEDTDPWVFWVHTKPNVGNISLEYGQHAEGDNTVAIQRSAHAEGRDSIASGKYSHTEGRETLAGYASHAEGRGTKAIGEQSHTEGRDTIAYNNAHAEGLYRVAKGGASHAEGQGIKNNETIGALGVASHVEGKITTASATGAHAEGSYTNAQGVNSHAEGTGVKDDATGCPDLSYGALGEASHSEGSKTTASGLGAHSEGVNTVAGNSAAHSEGWGTIASGRYTHVEGLYAKATGQCSHAQGYYTEAKKSYSDVAGAHTKSSAMYQSVVGVANKDNPDALLIVGNGEIDGDEKISESNAFEVLKDGTAKLGGNEVVTKDSLIDFLSEYIICGSEEFDSNSIETNHPDCRIYIQCS